MTIFFRYSAQSCKNLQSPTGALIERLEKEVSAEPGNP